MLFVNNKIVGNSKTVTFTFGESKPECSTIPIVIRRWKDKNTYV